MEFIGKWKVLKTMYFTEDGVKHLTKEEIIAQDGEDADLQMFDAIIEFTEDGAVKTLVHVPADQIEEAKAAGMPIDADGFMLVEESEWKEEDGKAYMAQEDGPFFLELTEDGLLKFAMGMMLLEKID